MIKNKNIFLKATKLRKQGNSYGSIQKQLGLSKSTLSSWFSDKYWSKHIADRLNNNNKVSSINRLIRMNAAKKQQKHLRYEEYVLEANKEYDLLKNLTLFNVGLSLYWGEGDKVKHGRVSVINTDTHLLQTVILFYRSILKIPESKLRAGLFIYNDLDEERLIDYWSVKLRLPKKQFIKTQKLKSRSRLTKRRSTYGICSIYFSDTKTQIKIIEWIRLLSEKMRV